MFVPQKNYVIQIFCALICPLVCNTCLLQVLCKYYYMHLTTRTAYALLFILPFWQAYRSSMLKAFKKTVEEGDFTFVIGMHLLDMIAKFFLKHNISTI